ncbi:MAG TPA: hypothetical protein VNQ53_05740 [Nocardioides sp.]|nr:hypothetical protein [Nocardioides sp.]
MLRRLSLAVLLAPALVACSDGDDGASEEDAGSAYYVALAELTTEMDEANTAADQELNDALPTTKPGQVGNLFSEATLESADRLEETLDEMAELEPPEDAEAAHEELLTATRAELELSRDLGATLAGLDQQAVEALRPPPEQTDIELRTDVACLTLQRLANKAETDVELCVGMFAPPAGG